jgi:glycine oxidase
VTIVVAGAGVIGCAVAHELASRGARVQIVDPRGVGEGATRASAGILAPYIEGRAPALLELGVHSLALYDGFIQRTQADAGIAVEYERCGTLQAALDPQEAEALAAAVRALAGAGVEHALLDGAEARRAEPALSGRTAAALVVAPHGYVAAAPLTLALAAAARARGACVSSARVLSVEDRGGGVDVRTDRGTISADAVVVAAGSWSPQISPRPGPPPVRPIRGQLVHLRAPARPASRVVWGSGCYVVPWRDGSVLVGATLEDVGFDERATASGVERLLAAAVALMPGLRESGFEQARAGLRPETPDELPIIGRSSTMPCVFYATGHYRNGVLLAPLTASLVADLVVEGRERPELAGLRPDRVGL